MRICAMGKSNSGPHTALKNRICAKHLALKNSSPNRGDTAGTSDNEPRPENPSSELFRDLVLTMKSAHGHLLLRHLKRCLREAESLSAGDGVVTSHVEVL